MDEQDFEKVDCKGNIVIFFNKIEIPDVVHIEQTSKTLNISSENTITVTISDVHGVKI